jgi:phospholipid/cholesterol/gamma-HCH transport system permease protein
MSLRPVPFVVAPRLLAVLLMVPAVTMLGNLVGMFGGLVVSEGVLDLSWRLYLDRAWATLDTEDVWRGLFKSVVFALIVGAVGCYQGFQARGGAEGVGRSTTRCVVRSIIAIIVADAILNYFLLFRL